MVLAPSWIDLENALWLHRHYFECNILKKEKPIHEFYELNFINLIFYILCKPVNDKIITTLWILRWTMNLPKFSSQIILRKPFLHESLLWIFLFGPKGKTISQLFISIFKLSQSFEERYRVKINKIIHTNKNIFVHTLWNMIHNSGFDKHFEWLSY